MAGLWMGDMMGEVERTDGKIPREEGAPEPEPMTYSNEGALVEGRFHLQAGVPSVRERGLNRVGSEMRNLGGTDGKPSGMHLTRNGEGRSGRREGGDEES